MGHSALSSSGAIRSSFRIAPVGNGRGKPGDGQISKRFTRNNQIIMDHNAPKGFIAGAKVRLIEPTREGRAFIGVYNEREVIRVGYVNGIQDKGGRTVGRWEFTGKIRKGE